MENDRGLLKTPSRHFPTMNEENHKNLSQESGLRAETWSRDLPNMKQQC
jgi:hypothetical protein